MFTVALFTTANIRKQPQCPLTDKWMETWYIRMMEHYSAVRRKSCHL